MAAFVLGLYLSFLIFTPDSFFNFVKKSIVCNTYIYYYVSSNVKTSENNVVIIFSNICSLFTVNVFENIISLFSYLEIILKAFCRKAEPCERIHLYLNSRIEIPLKRLDRVHWTTQVWALLWHVRMVKKKLAMLFLGCVLYSQLYSLKAENVEYSIQRL